MFLGVVQIVLRTVFRAPIFGYIDIVEIAMVGFAVLAISYVQRVGGHVRMELLVAKLNGRAHWLAETIGSLLGIFIVAVLIPYSYDHFQRAFDFGDSHHRYPARHLAGQAGRAGGAVDPAAAAVHPARAAMSACRSTRRWSRSPWPLLKDVEEIAEEEIPPGRGGGAMIPAPNSRSSSRPPCRDPDNPRGRMNHKEHKDTETFYSFLRVFVLSVVKFWNPDAAGPGSRHEGRDDKRVRAERGSARPVLGLGFLSPSASSASAC